MKPRYSDKFKFDLAAPSERQRYQLQSLGLTLGLDIRGAWPENLEATTHQLSLSVADRNPIFYFSANDPAHLQTELQAKLQDPTVTRYALTCQHSSHASQRLINASLLWSHKKDFCWQDALGWGYQKFALKSPWSKKTLKELAERTAFNAVQTKSLATLVGIFRDQQIKFLQGELASDGVFGGVRLQLAPLNKAMQPAFIKSLLASCFENIFIRLQDKQAVEVIFLSENQSIRDVSPCTSPQLVIVCKNTSNKILPEKGSKLDIAG